MSARCYGCGRETSVCWIMPCLVLEQAMTRVHRLMAWATRCGLVVKDRAALADVVEGRRRS